LKTADQTPGKNREIEILRGFAILFTLIVHLKVLLPPGNVIHSLLSYVDLSVGVDLFLVISGFVITGSVLESGRDYHGPVRNLMLGFWVKRIFRLLPAAWGWVLVAVLLQLLVTQLTDIQYAWQDIVIGALAALMNAMNFYTPHCVANGGGLPCILENYLGHYWSLSLEEQFYIVFPLLFFLLPRRVLVAVLVLALIAQFSWSRPLFHYSWYFKTDALCWGILLALLSRVPAYRQLSFAWLEHRFFGAMVGLFFLALLPLVAIQIQGVGFDMKPYGVAVVAILCAIIVWLAALEKSVFSLGYYYDAVMLYLGSRSYSLYLSHLIAYFTVRDLMAYFGSSLADTIGASAYALLLLALAWSFTLLGAELSYRYIESRYRGYGRKIAGRLRASAQTDAATMAEPRARVGKS